MQLVQMIERAEECSDLAGRQICHLGNSIDSHEWLNREIYRRLNAMSEFQDVHLFVCLNLVSE